MNTSVISEKALIGKNVSIGHFCIIEDDVIIGDNTHIGNYCVIKKGAVIGKNCRFTAYCEIRDHVKIGDFTTFGSRCTISANACIGSRVTIKYGFVLTDTPVLEQGDVKVVGTIGDDSLIGANVCLMPGFNIGMNATIGACSQVRDHVGDGEIWFGNPARLFKTK
ncbi:MAG TPA: DapH/DapD/GlmU-related protein [Chitinophagaceae bacterium]|nr:DapH/DapD/GlmU-related protein [Chitinophagaceae bacterium]HNF72392.1 DapH/DapD/GlmU-related protein [Chitinophagaceae bacterium]